MIRIKNLVHYYGTQKLCDIPKLEVEKGKHLLVKGNSGSGKTTLLNIIGGLLTPEKGEVEILGKNISQLKNHELDELRGKNIGFIFQKMHLIPHMTVVENIELAQYMAGNKPDRTEILKKLEKVGLKAKKNSLPENLSVGETQRVAIIRAIINHPKIVLADEPTSSLDDKTTDDVIDLLFTLAKENGSSLIVASHDDRIKKLFKTTLTMAAAK